MLSGALREQLLGPRAERRDLVVGEERELVTAVAGQGPDGETERDAGVRVRIRLTAGREHRGRRLDERIEVDPDERCRDEPDIGQRAIPAADVRIVQKDLAELV